MNRSTHDPTADPSPDRRSGGDRRIAYDLDYFEQGGPERRKGGERRKPQQKEGRRRK
jgi:hypothetical protein